MIHLRTTVWHWCLWQGRAVHKHMKNTMGTCKRKLLIAIDAGATFEETLGSCMTRAESLLLPLLQWLVGNGWGTEFQPDECRVSHRVASPLLTFSVLPISQGGKVAQLCVTGSTFFDLWLWLESLVCVKQVYLGLFKSAQEP